MRVRFLRGTALGGVGNDAHPGDERNLPEPQAQAFIAAGRAVAVATQEPPPLQQALDAVAQAQAAMVAPTPAAAPARRPRKGKDT